MLDEEFVCEMQGLEAQLMLTALHDPSTQNLGHCVTTKVMHEL